MKQKNYFTRMLLLFALVVGSVSSVWAEDVVVATFDSDALVDNSTYATTYGGDDWSINMGGNNKSIGFNNKNMVAINDALGTDATAANYGIVVKSKNKLNNVNKITFVYTGGSGDGGKLYLAYSSDGLAWQAITLNSGTGLSAQGVTPSQNTTLTFEFEQIASAYYAFILDSGDTKKAAYRFDNVVAKFINVVEGSPLASIAISGTYLTSFYVNDEFSHEGAVVTATYEDASTRDVSATATFSAPDMTSTGTKEVTVSYTEGEVTKTATYNITVIERPALTSIALSGTYTTTFSQGDDFNHDGLVVTATYADDSTKDVTDDATFSAPDMTTIGTKTVTVSYTEGAVTETATYEITVNEYVQPTTVTIQMTNSLFGEEVHTSGKSTEEMTFVGTKDNVTVTYSVPNDSYYYFNTSNTRPYDTCNLTYAAPNGYVITKIVFTSDGQNWKTATPSVGSMTETKTWEGSASSVTFSWEESGTRIKTVVVTLAKIATITLASACTDGTDFFGTYSNESAFVVPSDLTVSAVSVAEGKLVVTDYETGDIVKANTGVMVSSATAGEHTVLLSSETGTEIDGNMLKSSGAGITAAEMTTAAPSCQYYRLTMHNGETIGYWWGAENGAAFAVVANKAYLAVPESAGAPALGFEFGDETTGIQNIERTVNDNQYYTLDGRRVAQPTKGLYIVNGKKVIIK